MNGKGLIGSVVSVMVAEVSPMLQGHIPPLIMDVFQVGAWASAILISLITLLKYIQRQKERELKK